jgi:hypothetical protein
VTAGLAFTPTAGNIGRKDAWSLEGVDVTTIGIARPRART